MVKYLSKIPFYATAIISMVSCVDFGVLYKGSLAFLSSLNPSANNSLADMSEKFRLVDDPVLASWEIRFIIVNNYLAFYTIDKEKQMVIVIRFPYQKSSWNSILRQGFSLI